MAGAKVDVQDGPDIGRKAASDATGRYVLDGLTPGSITIKIEKDGYDNSYVKVTLSGPAVAQNVTMTKTAPAPPRTESTGIVFLGSDPAPGGETALTEIAGSVYLTALRMQFAVQYSTALPDAKFEVQLLGESGQVCASTFIDQAMPANQSVTISAPHVVWGWEAERCAAYPVATATVKATLLTQREPMVNGRLQRTDYIIQSFPIRYSIRRYPTPPPGAPASTPVISDLSWRVALPVGGVPPIPGDPVNIWCTARESDGAPMTVTITVTWDGLAPITSTRPFEAGASSSPSGAYHAISLTAPMSPFVSHAMVDCAATNVRGETARKSTEIGVRR